MTPAVLSQAVLCTASIWWLSLVVATALYVSDPHAVRSFHGMWSSTTFYAPLVALFGIAEPTPMEGATVFCAAQLAYYSFGMWTVKRYGAWPEELRAASGITDNGVLEHDVMAMNYLAVTCFGLAAEHLLRTLCREPRRGLGAISRHVSAVAMLLSGIGCVAVQLLLEISPDGELSGPVHDNHTLAAFFLLTLLLELANRLSARPGLLVCLTEDVPIFVSLLGVFAVHSVAVSSHKGEKPRPAFDDLPASCFHAIVSVAICDLLLVPHAPRPRLAAASADERLGSRGLLAAILAFAPAVALLAFLARDMPAATYYSVHGALSIGYATCLVAVAALVLWPRRTGCGQQQPSFQGPAAPEQGA